MDWRPFILVKTGLYVNGIFAAFSLVIDRYFGLTSESWPIFHVGGTIVLILAAFAYICHFMTKPGRAKSWKFWGIIFPFFIFSCRDNLVVVDLYLTARGWIFPNYIHSGDAVLDSVWAESCEYFDGTILHLLNYIVLYKYHIGASWRSLMLFTGTFVLVSSIDLFPLVLTMDSPSSVVSSMSYMYCLYALFAIISIYMESKSFTFRASNKSFMAQSNSLDFVTIALMTLSVFIFFAEYLISSGAGGGLLNMMQDPMIRFETVKDAIPTGATHAWLHLWIVGPIMITCLWNMTMGGKKAEFLWDLAIFQAGILFSTKAYTFVGSKSLSLPAETRLEKFDSTFFIVNLIPIAAAILYMEHLSRDRLTKPDFGKKKQ